METRQFELHPTINGLALLYGIFDESVRSSLMAATQFISTATWSLYPCTRWLFISYNSLGKNVARPGEVLADLCKIAISRVQANRRSKSIQTSRSRCPRSERVYDGTRREKQRFLKILALLSQFALAAIRTASHCRRRKISGEWKKWKEIAPSFMRD